jgi:hypothetical protein
MEFSNGTEYISERELRKRIGGCFAGSSSPNDERYREAGFYPVQYENLLDFQKHDTASAYLYNDTIVIVPAVDMPLTDVKEQAIERIDSMRTVREVSGTVITYSGADYNISTSQNAQIKIQGMITLPESMIINWVTAAGTIQLDHAARLQFYTAVMTHIQDCFNIQSQYDTAARAAESVSALRTIIQEAQTAFDTM